MPTVPNIDVEGGNIGVRHDCAPQHRCRGTPATFRNIGSPNRENMKRAKFSAQGYQPLVFPEPLTPLERCFDTVPAVFDTNLAVFDTNPAVFDTTPVVFDTNPWCLTPILGVWHHSSGV